MLTGHYLLQKDAGVIFCVVGFLTSASLLWVLWGRYFAKVGLGVVALCTLALGLANGALPVLACCGVYEVPIVCGYAMAMLALAAVWKSLHEPQQRYWWLAAGSLAYGLAFGARPSLVLGGLILVAPVAEAWCERRRVVAALVAASGPIVFIGLGLMVYNALRFGNPFEFGWRYQLAAERQDTAHPFNLHYLWLNFRVYFLEPPHWSRQFPFVREITVPRLPGGYLGGEHPFGILSNIPVVWLAAAVPLGWRIRSNPGLRWFVVGVGILFGTSALTMGLFWAVSLRYEVEFLPALVLLAVIGILSVESTLARTSRSARAWQRAWGPAVRCGWGLLLGYSVAFNLLASVDRCAEADNNMGCTLYNQGRVSEALAQLEQAVRLNPDYAVAQYHLGVALARLNRLPEAIEHWEQALRIDPDDAWVHYKLGLALDHEGEVRRAIGHYERVVRLEPTFVEAHDLADEAFMRLGRVPDAIAHYEQALHIRPDFAEAHNDLRVALLKQGKVTEAITHWEQAVRLKPDFVEAHNNLGSALLGLGRTPEAIEQFEEAVRLKSDYAKGHYNLGVALEEAGRVPEAVEHYKEALRFKPDFVEAHNALAGLHAIQ